VGEPVWYDFKFIPADSVFYLTVFNKTKTGKTVNVYQELENSELIPCLPKDISIEKETAIEFTDILFVKQKDSKFTISYSEKE
jgi:hypothetical protein